jgi:AraC family transcriptional regulator of adaptative response/methylated-DNA-[protein]-cysteine methyltransferase
MTITTHTQLKHLCNENELCIDSLDSPIGELLIITNKNALLMLSFSENIESIQQQLEYTPIDSPILHGIEDELIQYFQGTLKKFNTPIQLVGTPFQNLVWQSLLHIPYGSTISYTQQAGRIGNPKATRAVAKANSTNPLPIIIPCHRVINHNGQIGGYAGGLDRKQWLLSHEQNNTQPN